MLYKILLDRITAMSVMCYYKSFGLGSGSVIKNILTYLLTYLLVQLET